MSLLLVEGMSDTNGGYKSQLAISHSKASCIQLSYWPRVSNENSQTTLAIAKAICFSFQIDDKGLLLKLSI